MKNILKYLKQTKDVFLVYGRGLNSKLRVMWKLALKMTRMIANCKMVTYLLLTMVQSVGRVPKQRTTTESITKAEYISTFEAAKEGVWIRKFITELGVVLIIVYPITLYYDNNDAIVQAKEPRSHQ